VEKDEVEAGKWYHKAAEQGDVHAQSFLGNCYDEGIGVEKDEVEAVKWFRKAAEQGDTSAQFFLGSCYNEGKGMEKDEIEAYAYFNLAAITAAFAREKRDAMESGMESTQRAEGQRRTKELQAQIEKSQGK
jgi:TPR repeat protein